MLRTRNDNVDLSQIAKTFGGGGHPRAARFTWKGQIDNLWQFMDSKIKKTSKTKKSSKKSSKTKKSKSKNTFF
jgi:nanoRNase/pAp phosphatase (c-di-AMP/oligoRNAs hydrolase)